jgi:hypothetical protein
MPRGRPGASALVSSHGAAPPAEGRIRSVIDAWAIWRDSGAWDALRSTWAPEGRINTTWFRGAADDFIEASREALDAASPAHHVLGGTVVEVNDGRAVAQTRVTISQRLLLGDTDVDVTCVARFFDFFERSDGAPWGWQIVLREPIYEKDRIDPVVPGELPLLDRQLLASLPAGCRHLLYCQLSSGMQVHTDVLTGQSEALAALHLDGEDWLAGKHLGR